MGTLPFINSSQKSERTGMNEIPCPKCDGRGYTTKVNLLKAKTDKIHCEKCRGTGKVFVDKINGIQVVRQLCQVFYFQDYVDNNPVATLHVHMCPVMDQKTGKPAYTPNVLNPKDMKPRIFIQIVHMATKPDYRRQGRMRNLLMKAMEDPKIEWVETSWDDSSDDGRNFLLMNEFKREKGKLIWRRGNPILN